MLICLQIGNHKERYVVRRQENLGNLKSMEKRKAVKAAGTLDRTVITGDALTIEGWAASEGAGKATGFNVMIGEQTCQVVEQILHIPSGDVKAVWPGMDDSERCRFLLRVALPSPQRDLQLSVEPSFELGVGEAFRQTLTIPAVDLSQLASQIAAADDAYRAGNSELAKKLYRQALTTHPCCLEAHNKIESIGGAGTFSHNFQIIAQIDPRDDIFRFFENHGRARNPIREYLSDGWRTLSELLILLEKLNIRLSNCRSFLEFASGFGRFTRHLVNVVGGPHLWVSDVVDGSVDFLRETFGVSGFYSSLDPLQMEVDKKFEIIFVLSLFSHLPEALWQPWISRLISMLEPGGALIFTTHGERASRDMGYVIPECGYGFVEQSESRTLDGACYGTAFASNQFVTAALRNIAPGCRVEFFPAQFWAQDAYVVFAEQAH